MTNSIDLVFEPPPARLVRRWEVTLLVDQETGEVVDWAGLNDDPERCPGERCGSCTARCSCAPCRCSECVARGEYAGRPVVPPARGGEPQLRLI
jgi:hypothetical protein